MPTMFCIMPLKEQRLPPLQMPFIDVRPLGPMRRARSFPGFIPFALHENDDGSNSLLHPLPMDESVHCNGFNMMHPCSRVPLSESMPGNVRIGEHGELVAAESIPSDIRTEEQGVLATEAPRMEYAQSGRNLANTMPQGQSEAILSSTGQVLPELQRVDVLYMSNPVLRGTEGKVNHTQPASPSPKVACQQLSPAFAKIAPEVKQVQMPSSKSGRGPSGLPTLLGSNSFKGSIYDKQERNKFGSSMLKQGKAVPAETGLLGKVEERKHFEGGNNIKHGRTVPAETVPLGKAEERNHFEGGAYNKHGSTAIAHLGAAEAPITTMMIRNLPSSMTQIELLHDLNNGFQGLYDFCYLPRDFATMQSKGFAFVNFIDPLHAIRFAESWHGRSCVGSAVALSVSAADVQGLQKNLGRWAGPRMRRIRNPALKPFVVNNSQDISSCSLVESLA
eukprot:TRINITY_DN103178_c0_g1_i1.p1 TRINITY_DN103178_c0_g1~~TRINITY_DN103178_c0_g1_i1.p1  ORF type:complete len:465 (-),score=83.54 TRINITY_DN103178_c0_g1_i1:246-1586(-)